MQSHDVEVNVYSHHFTVKSFTYRTAEFVRSELLQLVSYTKVKQGRHFIDKPYQTYARRSSRLSLYAFSIEQLESFLAGFKRITSEDRIMVKYHKPYKGKKVKFKQPTLVPHNEQSEIIEAVMSLMRSAVTLRPGGGKTFIALYIAYLFGKVFCVITQGGYAAQWEQEFKRKDILGLEEDEYVIIRGVNALNKVIAKKKDGKLENVKGYFISTGTLRSYIKGYEKGDYEEFVHKDVPPHKLFKFLEIGFRITDEVHKEIHANYTIDMYTNIEKSVGLTGTLLSKDNFMLKIYEQLLPSRIRLKGQQQEPYRELWDVHYRFKEPEAIRYIGGQGMYSHVTFEQSIIKQPEVLLRWQRSLYRYVEEKWLLNRMEGEKIIIWFATIQMCELMTNYLKHRIPDLIVSKYNAEDSYDVILDSDVIVSTPMKSGTAIDIPDLTQAFNTVATDSQNAIVQAFGRLRKLKGDYKDLTPRYFAFICDDVPTHGRYAQTRKYALREQIKAYYTDNLPEPL